MSVEKQNRAKPEQYAYAVGKIRALEAKLLNTAFLERMTEAPTAEAALKILNEAPVYQEYVKQGIVARDFERMLEQELKNMYLTVEKLFYEKRVINAFRAKYDFTNAKAIIRNLYLKEKKALEFFDFGLIDAEKLKYSIESRDFRDMPKSLAMPIQKALGFFDQNKDPQELDFILDKAWCDYAYSSTQDIVFVNEYLKSFVDLNNTMTFLRCAISKKDAGFLKKALLDNGRIPMKEFVRLYERSHHDLYIELSRRDYLKYIKDGVDEAFNQGSLERLEKEADDYLISYLKSAKYTAFGLEPIFAYMVASENQAILLRNVLIGKIYNQSPEQIRKGQRLTYV